MCVCVCVCVQVGVHRGAESSTSPPHRTGGSVEEAHPVGSGLRGFRYDPITCMYVCMYAYLVEACRERF